MFSLVRSVGNFWVREGVINSTHAGSNCDITIKDTIKELVLNYLEKGFRCSLSCETNIHNGYEAGGAVKNDLHILAGREMV